MRMSEVEFAAGTILGEKVSGPRRDLDVFALPSTVRSVSYVSDEVTSVCPITGQPDFYEVAIRLDDATQGIESKSLKLYLQSFRDDGQFCEQFAHTIASGVRAATGASTVTVSVRQKPRGGVAIEARSLATGEPAS
jgi:7-cyano-7-deazaguanine reductase